MKSTKLRKRPRGRPKIGSKPVTVRLPPRELKRLDAFLKHLRAGLVSRPEAIRQLVKLGMNRYPPPGWGHDALSKHFEDAYRHRWHTFHDNKAEYQKLEQIDLRFMKVGAEWKSPPTPIEPLLFFSCHAAYRVACETAVAGEIQEAFTQLRSCLENGAYALHMSLNPGHDQIWAKRSDDDATRKAAKAAFKAVDVQATVDRIDRTLGDRYRHLYNRCIDFGAHPNEQGLFSRIQKTELADGVRFDVMYLQGDGLGMRHALRTTAQTGICVLMIFKEVFPDRFEHSGVDEEIPALAEGL